MKTELYTLSVMSIPLAIARLNIPCDIPLWGIQEAEFFSITKTREELSIVCSEENVPNTVRAEKGWRCLKVEGPLDFGLTGVLSALVQPLAEAKISIFAISTFDTDYIMIKKDNLRKAIEVLGTFCKIIQ